MRAIIATVLALAALAAYPAWATCNSPAVGTLADIMKQATWTLETGSNWRPRTAHVRIALPALAVPAWNCHTWDVALVLPPSASMKADAEGETGAASYAGLAAGATAEFAIQVAAAAHNGEIRDERGWLRVKVRNPDASPGVYLATPDGSPVWLFPVTVNIGVH